VRSRTSALIAIAGGLAGFTAFPRLGIWPMAILSVASLSVAVDGRRLRTATWLGYLYGLAFTIPLLSWTGVYVGPVPWLLLCAFESLFFAGLGAGWHSASRRHRSDGSPHSVARRWSRSSWHSPAADWR
jgi:apolipoprotein N-acyltransferase